MAWKLLKRVLAVENVGGKESRQCGGVGGICGVKLTSSAVAL